MVAKKKAKLLIAEPSPFIGRILKQKLEALHYTVTLITDLRTIYLIAKRVKPAAIVTDVLSPWTFEQCLQMKRDPQLRMIPVLFHSVAPTRRMVEAAAKVGAKTLIIKPAAISTLHSRISRFVENDTSTNDGPSPLKAQMDRYSDVADKIDRLLKKQKELKPFPNVVLKLMQLVQSGDSSAVDLAKVIKADTVITGAVLKKANSAYFVGGQKIASVQQAITRIGFAETKKILIGMSLVNMFEKQNKSINFTRKGFWEHSLAVGVLAAELAQYCSTVDAGDIFTAGLLHDIGKIIFDENLDSEFENAIETAARKNYKLHEAETLQFAFSHNELGYRYLQGLGLTDAINLTALHHNTTDLDQHELSGENMKFIEIVRQANFMVKALGYAEAGDKYLGDYHGDGLSGVNLTDQQLQTVIGNFYEAMADFKQFVDFSADSKKPGTAVYDSHEILYLVTDTSHLDIVELFLAHNGFKIRKVSSIEELDNISAQRPDKYVGLVQVPKSYGTNELSDFSDNLLGLNPNLPLICLSTRDQGRILSNTSLKYIFVYWPLTCDLLKSSLVDCIQAEIELMS